MKKPRVLKRKNIKRRTGSRSQASQILALSKQVSTLSKRTRSRFATTYQRDSIAIDSTTGSATCYIMPLPYNCCDPYESFVTNTANTWGDNLYNANENKYKKVCMFQPPPSIQDSQEIYHTGGVIKYQMVSNEPAYSKVTLALVQPRKEFADQLLIDRGMQTGVQPGANAEWKFGTDYICHTGGGNSTSPSTYFGTVFNSKLWKIVRSKEVAFSHPGGSAMASNVNPANTEPKNNATVATGTWRIPPAGLIVNCSDRADGSTSEPIAAIQAGILDSKQEKMTYLVAIQNGAKIDGEVISLAFHVTDYYTAYN